MNGVDWTSRTLPVSTVNSAFNAVYFDGKVWIPTSTGGYLCTSDAVNWDTVAGTTSAGLLAVLGNRIVGLSSSRADIGMSRDRVTIVAKDVLGNIIGGFGRIETGSYVGTGTYGVADPNTLTFRSSRRW